MLVLFLLLSSFFLLLFNQLFDHGGLGYVLIILHVVQFLLLFLLIFRVTDVLLYLSVVLSFVPYDFLPLLLSLSLVHQSHLSFFVALELLSELLLSLYLHVSASLGYNISRLLSSLVDFFVGTNFFLLEQ